MVRIRKSPYPSYQSSNPLLSDHANDLAVFEGKPFWCNNIASDNPTCCFNHIIGLPEKNDKTYPIFDYELDVIDKIEKNRNIWIKKASGIGATELILRYLTWKILINNDLEYKSIFIVSGTYVYHANELKDLRGYTDVSYLFIDEADHFEPSVNSELLHTITRYEEKSNCTTIMVSTPNKPDCLYQSIEKDPHSKYEKIILDYTVGLGRIYDPEEIKKKMNEAEFPKEYKGMYLGKNRKHIQFITNRSMCSVR